MQFRKYILFQQYLSICNFIFYDILSINALVGRNVRQAKPDEFPFIVGLIRTNQDFIPQRDIMCTAILITKQDILTSAHCFSYDIIEKIQIVIGSIDLVSHLHFYPAWWIAYDHWASINKINNGYILNDVFIIKLTRNVPNAKTAELSYTSYSNLNGKTVVTAGWGEANNGSFPQLLQTAQLIVLPNKKCLKRSSQLCGILFKIDNNLLCTQAEPFTILMGGDSGGPLMFQNKIIAINTGSCPFPQKSFHPEKMNLHTNVMHYKKFILDNVYIDE